MKLDKLLTSTIYILVVVFVCLTLVKGKYNIEGKLDYQSKYNTTITGPFEASNSTSRYVLTESIAKFGAFNFNEDQAKFASPDLTFYNGKYFSIFTPGVSFAGVPFYLLGTYFGMPQFFTYMSTVLFAVINVILIAIIVRKLGGNEIAGWLSGFIFLFATNAIVYAFSYTQHHLTVVLVLLSTLNILNNQRSFTTNLSLGLIYGIGALVDIPNIFLLAPFIIYALFENIKIRSEENKYVFNVRLNGGAIVIGMLPMVLAFGIYNHELTGSYVKLGQSIGRVVYPSDMPVVDTLNAPTQSIASQSATILDFKSPINLPFSTRKQLEGLNVLLINNERGWLQYSPVLFLGILGFISILKNKGEDTKAVNILIAVVLINILLYSMFGDPWGGWAFGARYLIPAAAVMSVMIGIALTALKKNWLFIFVFIVISAYSMGINLLGASTTSLIPPKQEAESLNTHIPYTYELNIKYLQADASGSLFFNVLGGNGLKLVDLVTLLFIFEFSVVAISTLALVRNSQHYK